MAYWLVKSDPDAYSWNDFEKDKETIWDGVRNYQARNNLKSMNKGDKVLFYHSQSDRAVVGVAKVSQEYFQDPTTKDDSWVAVKLKLLYKLNSPVTLSQIKSEPILSEISLIKQSRLSVMLLTAEEYLKILAMGV